MRDPKRVAILISGRGSNMAALIKAAEEPGCPFEICVVSGDNPDASGFALAEADGVPVARLPKPTPKDKSQFFKALDRVLRNAGSEYIALAGFMRILPGDFIDKWRGRIVNIHPSLLPKYRGLDTHARAIEAGDKISGCSVHVVTEELDAGEVLGQAEVPIEPGDTAQTLEQRVLAAEHLLYPQVLSEFVRR